MQGALPGQASIPRALQLGLPAPSVAAAATEAPSWLCFSPCFSNYVEWAKNSSSGALFGSYHHGPRKPAASLARPSQQPALCGMCPCCFDFCPHTFLIAGGFLGSALPAPGLNDLSRWLVAVSTPCVWFHRPGWPGRAGLGWVLCPPPRPWLLVGQAGGSEW